ncbi:MAG: hypothetical protein LBI78_07400 [Campylobacteraceae bacterium]|jgi:PBP1b-binding outer membrane lipoprotein LpoB|nr:hypothetical protein [Campylobacteraceae bacterium]
MKKVLMLTFTVLFLGGCATGFMPNASVSDNINGKTITSSNNILPTSDNKSIYFNPSATIFNKNINFAMLLGITGACDAEAFNKLKSITFDIGTEKLTYDVGQKEYYACGGEFNYTKLVERGSIRMSESDFVKLVSTEQLKITVIGDSLTSEYQVNAEFIVNLKTFYKFVKGD